MIYSKCYKVYNVVVIFFLIPNFLVISDVELRKSHELQWYTDAVEEAKLVRAVQQSMVEWKARSSRNR